MIYDVKFYKGDYAERQREANADGCVCYVEQHFNASGNAAADYCCVVVASNASQQSQDWGKWYTREIAMVFGIPNSGVIVGGFSGRGNANLKLTNMPAILLEPLFGSNPRQAAIIMSPDGRRKLAQVLAASIMCLFPEGGTVAFSVGHKYKTSNPADRGAAVLGSPDLHEADYAEMVLDGATRILRAITN